MFTTIRRHQAWLWWIIGGITVVSFLFLGPSSCNDVKLSGLGGANSLKIGDHTVTQIELARAEREAILRYFIMNQRWPEENTGFNVKREALIRLFLIEKEKQFGIVVGPEAQADYAHNLLGPSRLDDFVNQVLRKEGLDEGDFERYLEHEAGLRQLIAVTGLGGKLVTPGEAETIYREEHQDLATSLILFSGSNYMHSVTVSNADLMQFYTNRLAVYREPARMEVNYVKFNVTNYWDNSLKSLSNLDARLDLEMKRAGTNLFGKAKTPEESRAFLKDYIIRTNALTLAGRDANAFANELYDMKPSKPENIETLAKQKGMTVGTTAPFDETEGPTNLDVMYNFPKIAFQLKEDEPFGQAVPAHDGVYVLGFKKFIASSLPDFKEVEAKVTEDYRYYEGSMLAQQMAIKAYSEFTNGLAQGRSFNVLAAQLGLKTESLPPFALDTQKLPENVEERVSLNALRQAAFGTDVGHVSPPARALHGIFLLYVEKKLPVDETKMKQELPAFTGYVRQVRENDAFNQWIGKEASMDPSFTRAIQQASQETQARAGAGPKR